MVGFLREYFYRPQQVRLRRWTFQVHLWIGVLLALYAVVIGLTGSILVFRDELEAITHPEVRQAAESNAPLADIGTITATLRADFLHGELSSIFPPDDDRPTIRAYVRQDGSMIAVSVDPTTGKVLGHFSYTHDWLGTVDNLHVRLLRGRTGQIINGICALLLILMFFTGIVIWWPGRVRWTRALGIHFRAGAKRINFDLHSAVGFWMLGLLMMWAISGVYLIWPGPVRAVVNRISQVTTVESPALFMASLAKTYPPEHSFGRHSPRTVLSNSDSEEASSSRSKWTPEMIHDFLGRAQAMVPQGKFVGIAFPRRDRGPLAVYMARCQSCDTDTADFIYFNVKTGKYLMTWHRGLDRTLGDRILSLMTPLHFGDQWGQGIKVLWALFGLALPVLAVTGLLMYWNRFLRRKWRIRSCTPNERVHDRTYLQQSRMGR